MELTLRIVPNELIQKLESVGIDQLVPERRPANVGEEEDEEAHARRGVHEAYRAHVLLVCVGHHVVLPAEPKVAELAILLIVAHPHAARRERERKPSGQGSVTKQEGWEHETCVLGMCARHVCSGKNMGARARETKYCL